MYGALRHAGRSPHDVLGLHPQAVRFVNSLTSARIEPVRRRLALSPGVRFKLDAEATWTPALVDEVARPARSTRSTVSELLQSHDRDVVTQRAVRRLQRLREAIDEGPSACVRDARQ